MGVKYVKDFSFPSSGGFHGDVQRYAKGGHVTKMPAKAKASAKDMPARAKPNAPAKGAPKMASKPAVGKRQGYDKGGRVPGREMDRLPTKRPPGRMKDLVPARRFKGKYEGYAEGGPVAEILPGDGRGGLDAVPRPPINPVTGEYGDMMPDYESRLLGGDLRDEYPIGTPLPYMAPYLADDGVVVETLRPSKYVDDIVMSTMPVPVAAPEPQYPVGPKPPDDLDLPPVGALTPLPEEPNYNDPRYVGPGQLISVERDVFGRSGLNRGPAAFELPAPRTRADIMADRREMVGARGARRVAREPMARRMAARAATPRMGIPKPVPPIEMLEELPRDIRYYKKGGEVKGKSKIGKVMGEYKAGKLHSGSKKGPKVTSEKQAMAIALSEARKAGAKIPKKAEGGIFSNEDMAYESKGPKTRYTAAKGRRMARERAMERRALDKARHAEKYAPGMSLDMPDKKKHGGMPVHRRKPMYGGGKC